MSGKLLVPMRMIMIPNISRNSFDPETRGTGSGLVQRTELLLTRADVGPGAFVSGIG